MNSGHSYYIVCGVYSFILSHKSHFAHWIYTAFCHERLFVGCGRRVSWLISPFFLFYLFASSRLHLSSIPQAIKCISYTQCFLFDLLTQLALSWISQYYLAHTELMYNFEYFFSYSFPFTCKFNTQSTTQYFFLWKSHTAHTNTSYIIKKTLNVHLFKLLMYTPNCE